MNPLLWTLIGLGVMTGWLSWRAWSQQQQINKFQKQEHEARVRAIATTYYRKRIG